MAHILMSKSPLGLGCQASLLSHTPPSMMVAPGRENANIPPFPHKNPQYVNNQTFRHEHINITRSRTPQGETTNPTARTKSTSSQSSKTSSIDYAT